MKSIGLDFGTGNSILAHWHGAKAIVFNGLSEDGIIPSDIVFNENIIIPEVDALKRAILAGKGYEKAIKRRLIAALETGDVAEVSHLKELASARLQYIYDAYIKANKEPIIQAVLTCPANAGQAYRNALTEIGRKIGLPSLYIVDEPTAAAIHHGLGEKASEDERWMVIDWGCGTCDVSLIERTKGSQDLEVACVKGDNLLGGMDMDARLCEYLAKKFKFLVKDANLYEIEEIKKELSISSEVKKNISISGGKTIAVSCSKEELEKEVASLLTRVDGLVKAALKEIGWGSVDCIIATGGPMLMPCVISTITAISDEMGAELLSSDPLTSVALGAAALSEIKRVGGFVVTNQVAKSIGIRVVDKGKTDAYHVVIKRGENRPVYRSVELMTSIDLQDIIEIEVREGDNPTNAESNILLARLKAVVRPENKGKIKIRLSLALTDSGALEANIEPIGEVNSVREIQSEGMRVEKGKTGGSSVELRSSDPVAEFKEEVVNIEADPDTARQVCDKLKIKYYPDRQPEKRDYWLERLKVLDTEFNIYLSGVEKRMRASVPPELPWDKPAELKGIIIDEIKAQRLTHCIANNIGTKEQLALMPELLKRFPDYRRVVAAYLFGIKCNIILQKFLGEDDRPHVGLVVLLQNIPGKSIRERHAVLKAAYRVKEDKVRKLLLDPSLEIEKLYDEVPKLAEVEQNPMGGTRNVVVIGGAGRKLNFDYRNGDTVITGSSTFDCKEDIKKHGARWDGQNKAWVIRGKKVTEKDIYPDK